MIGAGRYSVETKVAAVEEAQSTVRIRLATWLRQPTKEGRYALDEALAEFESLISRLVPR